MAGNANLGTWQVGTLCFSYFMLFSYKNTNVEFKLYINKFTGKNAFS